MNIIEAFKASNCGKVIRNGWLYPVRVLDNVSVSSALADDWEPVNDPLTFGRIRKECVAGKTLLISEDGNQRLYLGFTRKGRLVTDYWTGETSVLWEECNIKDWRIGGEWSGNKEFRDDPRRK